MYSKNHTFALDQLPSGSDRDMKSERVSKRLPDGITSSMLYQDILRIALPATVKVGLNNKITLDVAFNPVNATNKNIKWYVEDDSIIRLTPGDAQAEIIGTKLGSTKVTAVSEDGGHVAECIVTVTEKEVGPPETGAVSMVLTGAMLVVAGIAVNMGKRRKKH